MRRSRIDAKRYTLGKIARPTAIDRFSLRLAVTRCVYPLVECSRKRRQENHSADRSAVDQSSVKDAVTWRTIFSTYVFNTKIFHKLAILLYQNRVKYIAAKSDELFSTSLVDMVERSPKELSCTCAFCIIKSAC